MPQFGYLENGIMVIISGTFHQLEDENHTHDGFGLTHEQAHEIASAMTKIRPLYEIPTPDLDEDCGICAAQLANLSAFLIQKPD